MASNQELTLEWWAGRKSGFDLYASAMDYLLTWNCRHIANAVTLPKVYEVCRDAGYEPPFVCTPQELMEGSADD